MKFEHASISNLSAFAQATLRSKLHDHGWKQGDNVPDTEWQMLVEEAQHADFIRLEAARFRKLLDHWCPENLQHEGMPNTLMRYRLLRGPEAPTGWCQSHPALGQLP